MEAIATIQETDTSISITHEGLDDMPNGTILELGGPSPLSRLGSSEMDFSFNKLTPTEPLPDGQLLQVVQVRSTERGWVKALIIPKKAGVYIPQDHLEVLVTEHEPLEVRKRIPVDSCYRFS
ncbi:hypothetical protein ACFLY9_02710 [Patescibacteria group bacterium]